MKHIDLFAGIGGFSLAARWLGWETIAFCEQDKFCQKVLRKNFGQDIEIYDDIRTFSAESFRGRCGIITGGFPCQPFSQAGAQKGRSDERHLFPQMLRVISEVRPKFVVAENVRGLLSIENGEVFAEVCSSLESEGYEVITFCVPASAVDAPHRRDRLWIVAHANGGRLPRRSAERSSAMAHCFGNGQSSGDYGSAATGADSVSNGNGLTSDTNAERQSQQKRFVENFGRRVGNGDCFTSDTESERCREARRFRCDESTQRIAGGSQKFDSDTNGEGFQRRDEKPGRRRESEKGFGLRNSNAWNERWLDVALRTCVRGVSDGLSAELDFVGSRDNRTSRLKALGNAIVPQIAFEIFQAINEVENLVEI